MSNFLYTLQGCSHGMIATLMYLEQQMGYNVVYGNCTMWTLTLNPIQLIASDKEITVTIALCEQTIKGYDSFETRVLYTF